MPAKNGINMLDVKVRNRRAILELIYRSKKIPRKDIATQLGLTPAAITLITNDLIREGILIETEKKESNSRGRREVLLQINAKKFYVIGVSITRNHYELIAMDLNKEILYQNKFRTVDFHHDAKQILAAIMETIQSDILSSSVINKKKLLGIGVSTLGIVNSETGVSLNSYGVFHESIAIADIFEKRFNVPTLLTNNICASAHAEAFLANSALETGRLLFINYGPDIGSALLSNTDYFNIYDYRAVQLAHVTVEPHGRPCICGNSGCLETVVSYDAIAKDLEEFVRDKAHSKIYHALHDSSDSINIMAILQEYENGNVTVQTEIDRVVFHMVTAIKNAITLLNPDSVILYGEPFDSRKLRYRLVEELTAYTKAQKVSFSDFNMQLEVMGPATTAISAFFLSGGEIPR